MGGEMVTRLGTVLIIEDDHDIRDAIRHFLEEEGYPVVDVRDGEEAVRYLQSSPLPDLILLDVMMARMNGYEFRAEQLRHPMLANIPTVIVTAAGRLVQKPLLAGAPVLCKPFDVPQL